MLLDRDPDLTIITEANILDMNMEYELYIPGYSLILAKTMEVIGYCRVDILCKDGINVEVLDK